MSGPVRIQRKRTKGWRMPPNTIYVGRPAKWGNPYDWREWLENAPRKELPTAAEREQWCRQQAVEAYAADIRSGVIVLPFHELKGHRLACWCPRGPRYTCHADVLLEIANRED